MNSKTFFLNTMISENGTGPLRILEMGCGTARYMQSVLDKNPHISYVGLEPFRQSFEVAKSLIGSRENVTLHNQLGYGSIEGVSDESFDIVYSISALEHVKDLGAFIEMSARYLKKGGLMVHRYDLGHALYPASLKERFQVFLGNQFPSILSEHKFVRYVGESEVIKHFNAVGCVPYRRTYHQMPNHKLLAREVETVTELESALDSINLWEWKNADFFGKIPSNRRERLFPSIAIWGRKG